MAYYDVLSQDAYGRFNRKFAKLTSLEIAVYWSEILDIITHVVKKKSFDENGFFKLERDYILDRTSIQPEDQLNFDIILEKLNILERNLADCNMIRVDLAAMEKLLIDDNIKKVDLPKSKLNVSRAEAAKNKKEIIIATMKKCIQENNEELKNKYYSWVESIYASGRFLTKAKIQVFMDTINKFSNDNKVKLDILDIGIQTGWDNAEWLINKYNSIKKDPVKLAPQRSATGTSDKYEF